MIRLLTLFVWIVAGVLLGVFVVNLLAVVGVDLGVFAQERTQSEGIAATINAFLLFGGAFVLGAILSLLSKLVNEVKGLRKDLKK